MTAERFFHEVLDGAGWCSDGYILNQDDLSDPDQYRAMIMLAKAGKLYDEEEIPEEELVSDDEPSIPSMNVEEVHFNYGYLIGEI